jgi:hypothetical protein
LKFPKCPRGSKVSKKKNPKKRVKYKIERK